MIFLNEIITNVGVSFATAFATSSFSKAAGPGQALDDLMTLAGFDKLHTLAEKNVLNKN